MWHGELIAGSDVHGMHGVAADAAGASVAGVKGVADINTRVAGKGIEVVSATSPVTDASDLITSR